MATAKRTARPADAIVSVHAVDIIDVVARMRDECGPDDVDPIKKLRFMVPDPIVIDALKDGRLSVDHEPSCIFAAMEGDGPLDDQGIESAVAGCSGTCSGQWSSMAFVSMFRGGPSVAQRHWLRVAERDQQGIDQRERGMKTIIARSAESGDLPPGRLLYAGGVVDLFHEKDTPVIDPERYREDFRATLRDHPAIALDWMRSGDRSSAAMAIAGSDITLDRSMLQKAFATGAVCGPAMAPAIRARMGMSDAETADLIAGLVAADGEREYDETRVDAHMRGILVCLPPADPAGRDDACAVTTLLSVVIGADRWRQSGEATHHAMHLRQFTPTSWAVLRERAHDDRCWRPEPWLTTLMDDVGAGSPLSRTVARFGHRSDGKAPGAPHGDAAANDDLLAMVSWMESLGPERPDIMLRSIEAAAFAHGVWTTMERITEALADTRSESGDVRRDIADGVLGGKGTEAARKRMAGGGVKNIVDVLTGPGSKMFLDGLAAAPDRARDAFAGFVAARIGAGVDESVAMRVCAALAADRRAKRT